MPSPEAGLQGNKNADTLSEGGTQGVCTLIIHDLGAKSKFFPTHSRITFPRAVKPAIFG